MNILAIDPATETGWATSREYYGTWSLKRHMDETMGIRLLRFRGHLVEIFVLYGVQVVGYEKPGGRNYRGIVSHAKLVGEIEKLCEEKSIPCKGYSAGEIKRHATGKGNSGKPAMIKAAQEKLGYIGNNENEADALWIMELMKTDLNLRL